MKVGDVFRNFKIVAGIARTQGQDRVRISRVGRSSLPEGLTGSCLQINSGRGTIERCTDYPRDVDSGLKRHVDRASDLDLAVDKLQPSPFFRVC